MIDDKNKEELIENIKSQLKQFELPYQEGKWEQFASAHIKRSTKAPLWKYWTAAAALIAVAGVSYIALRNENNPVQTVTEETSIAAALPQRGVVQDDELKKSMQRSMDDIVKGSRLSKAELYDSKPFTYSHAKIADQVPSSITEKVINTELIINENNNPKQIETTVTVSDNGPANTRNQQVERDPVDNRTVGDRLATLYNSTSQRQEPKLHAAQGDRKWEVGAFVSPAATSTSITLGGGVALAYNLSDKVSIRSGVAMQQYGGTSAGNRIEVLSRTADFPNLPIAVQKENATNSALLSETSSVDNQVSEHVSGKILTVDIPVDLRYAISKNIYTSVGVSYVGIIDQERTRIYNTGNAEYREKSNQSNVVDNGVNGFVNFSVGRKQKIGSMSISIEPYFKTPIGRLRSSDLNYNNGGVKIITSF